jgi:peptidoglycan/LPS O-acetylase OafA/YrhL
MSEPASRVHLGYLDGVRGWASLFVVLHHIWQFAVSQTDMGRPPRWFTVMTVFKWGPLAVTVFIVLSGYSLMIPVVRTAGATFSDGLGGFFHRRARRILPPYYATVVVCILLLLVFPSLQRPTGTQWDLALPPLTTTGLSLHAVLMHNLFEQWRWSLNPPLWSVALEWQIYFLFALLLLPIWRRLPPPAVVAAAFAIGFAPLPFGGAFAHTWYVGSFACGMWASAANFAKGLSGRHSMVRAPWNLVTVALLAPVAYWLAIRKGDLNDVHHWAWLVAVHTCVSFATAAFLAGSTAAIGRKETTPLLRALAHPISARLGAFSYSLYLLHYPLVALLYLPLRLAHIRPVHIFGLLVVVGVPVILGVSYAFHLAFEKPFLRGKVQPEFGSSRTHGNLTPDSVVPTLDSSSPGKR